MAFRLATIARNDACNGVVDLLDSGQIQIYTGTQPGTAGATPTGTLLGTCVFGAAAFGDAVTGTATANAITADSSADDSGTAGCFRLTTSGGTSGVADGTCGQGAGDLSFDNSVIVAGGEIAVTSFTVTVPTS